MSEENKDEESMKEKTEETREEKEDADEEKEKKKKGFLLLLLLLLLLVILIIFCGIWILVIKRPQVVVVRGIEETNSVTEIDEGDNDNDSRPTLPDYDSNAVALDSGSLQKTVDDIYKTDEGYITIDFFNSAYSTDGVNFTCRFGNSLSNQYDVFITVYIDDMEKPYYLSGLLRPGEMFNAFKGAYALAPGTYDSVLVFTQISEDHTAIVGQTSVVLTLNVGSDLIISE